jgi:hypothetical protein
MAAGPLLTGVVQEPVPDFLPDRLPAVEADRIDRLDFHGALAAVAGDAQHVALDLRKGSLSGSLASSTPE